MLAQMFLNDFPMRGLINHYDNPTRLKIVSILRI